MNANARLKPSVLSGHWCLDSLLGTYTSISRISAEEMRLLPFGGLAIWLHYTGIHVRRFDDFSNQFLSEEFLRYWIDTVNRWMEFNGIDI